MLDGKSVLSFKSSELEDNASLASDRSESALVRNIPVEDAKYLPVWKRARTKLQARFMLSQISKSIGLYGTSSNIIDESKRVRRNIDTILTRSDKKS
jgi:hypothetical protein